MTQPANASAPTYGFRLKFHLPAGRYFEGAVRHQRRMNLSACCGRVYLKKLPAPKRNRFGARVKYVLLGKNFASLDAAHDCGQHLKLALSLLAVEMQFGLDVGKDCATGSFSSAIKEALARDHDTQLRNDIHGLDVYCEQPAVKRVAIEAYGRSTRVLSGYEDGLRKFFDAGITVSAKQLLALDLYNLNHFENAAATRFLNLVTIVEVLSERTKLSKTARDFVKTLKQTIRGSNLAEHERVSLSKGLETLNQQSIGSACAEFVRRHGSTTDVAFFKDCYAARSELVHTGVTRRGAASDPAQLDALVSRLLLSSIVGGVSTPPGPTRDS